MKKAIKIGLLILFSASVLLWIAIYNGFPLVTPDSGAYLRFAFDFQVLKDRSPFYSVFCALTGLRQFQILGLDPTVWFIIAVQSVIVAYLLGQAYKLITGIKILNIGYLILVVIISIFTSVSWTVSYIMADIFTAILLLSIILVLYEKPKSARRALFYLSIVFLSTIVHNSHVLILLMFAIIGLIGSRFTRQLRSRKAELTGLLIVPLLCWLILSTMNYSKGLGFTLSSGSHVFMMGKLAEDGILKQYLHDNCEKEDLKLCVYKNDIPDKAWKYIWAEDGPFIRSGGWDSSRQENMIIIKDVFTTPKYLSSFILKSIDHTIQQTGNILIPEKMLAVGDNSSPSHYIQKHFKKEEGNFHNSRQERGVFDLMPMRYVHLWYFVITTLALFYFVPKLKNRNDLIFIYATIILFLLCNAFITASFANVLDRMQNRVFWVFPAINTFVFVSYFYNNRRAGVL